MEARRILLVLAMILLVTAAAASIVPVPEETSPERPDRSERPEGRPPEAVAPPADPGGSATEVAFNAQGKPQARLVERDSHVIVTVEGPGPGEVELAGLGRIAPVAPQTPATFDLFTERPGRFPVLYMPAAGGGERRLGTLVVGRS